MHFGRFFNKDDAGRGVNAEMVLEKVNVASAEVSLDRQLQAWRNNPSWTDEPPESKVSNYNCCYVWSCCWRNSRCNMLVHICNTCVSVYCWKIWMARLSGLSL